MIVQATPLASVCSERARSVSAGISIVCASAKASAESERMKRLRMGCGRGWGIAPQASEPDSRVRFCGCLSAARCGRVRREASSARARARPGEATGHRRRAGRAGARARRAGPAAQDRQPRLRAADRPQHARRRPSELLDPAINGAHADVEQISRTFLPYSHDQEGFDKVAEAYEKKMETPLQGALEKRLEPPRTCSRSTSACRTTAIRPRRRTARRAEAADPGPPALGCRTWGQYQIPSARWSRRRATTMSRASCVS